MFEQNTSPNIRVKKTYLMESNFLKTSNGMAQTRYSEPFSKFFLNKNKERINQVDSNIKANKYSERYLVNTKKL